jgi:hypothetical protein
MLDILLDAGASGPDGDKVDSSMEAEFMGRPMALADGSD